MGAKSTLDITRREAIDFIRTYLYEMDDGTLESLVEDINDYFMSGDYSRSLGLHNFRIVSEES